MNERTSSAPVKRVSILNYGCRLNQYEADGILQEFEHSNKYIIDPKSEHSDIVIVNSCTVTNQADKRSLQLIAGIKHKNPQTRIVMTGCYAQTDSNHLNKNAAIDLVIGNDHKSSLFSIVDSYMNDAETGSSRLSDQITDPVETDDHYPGTHHSLLPVLNNPFGYGLVQPVSHTRAYLKVQDGCDRKCSYCKIPQARGLGVSRPLKDVLAHVRELDDKRIPEIVITGVNLGWYKFRHDSKTRGFNDLIERILDSLSYSRLRLSSIEPCDIDARLGELSLHPKMCNFLHIPLQSGSRNILRAMRRTYSNESFIRRIETVRRINPDLFIGTDVIAGFPGETEDDFAQTLQTCKETGVAKIHAFPFSARQGTRAATLDGMLPKDVLKSRMKALALLSNQQNQAYAQRFVDKPVQGILEKIGTSRPERPAFGEFLTDNYLRIRVPFRDILGMSKGEFSQVRITELTQNERFFLGRTINN